MFASEACALVSFSSRWWYFLSQSWWEGVGVDGSGSDSGIAVGGVEGFEAVE